jgi:hypothetical protein
VGRGVEFRQLMRALRDVSHGDGRLVVVSGAAGLGKTRLAEELAARARTHGVRVGMGRCWHDGEAPPLWPWRDVLRDLDVPEQLLAADASESPHDRFARFVAVLEHLRGIARAAPLLIILDDVHMADAASLLLTRFLVLERRALRALFVITRREDSKDAPGRELLSELERDAAWIELGGLPPAAMRAYLTAFGARSVTAETLEAVATITRGNPLHLRSVALRSTLDGNVLGGLERALAGLVARLPAADRHVVGIAALLGLDVATAEVARVAEASTASVDDALARARLLGLVEAPRAGRVAFVHQLVRDAALGALSAGERLDAHARAAAALAGPDAEPALRRAHHALAAAERSPADAELALRVAREAAAALRAADGFEAVAALLARAVEVRAAMAPALPAAPLVADWAEAVLACGKLADARPLFRRAAQLAEAEGDATALARAALGLGGVWLREHRLTDETARIDALQRRALAALPPEATALRARLGARLAAEDAYRGGPLAPVLAAVEAARRTGDAQALAEALSLYHHVLLSPEHSHARLAIADELIAAAAAAGDGLLTLIGLCWRAADLFLLGDPRAEAALEELRLRADALQCGSVLFIVRAMDVMRAIRAGRFAEAETEAAACYALGVEVGDADALAYHGAQLAAIRAFQGREAELADLAASIAASPTLILERERSFALAAALFALRAGRSAPARAALAQLARDGLGSLPPSSGWLTSMLAVVELAAALDDQAIARAAYDALLPFADLPVMASLAVVCLGPTQRPLGLAALTCGEHDRAVEHLTAAVSAAERAAHRPAAIRARADLGLALIRRDAGSDAERGRVLVEGAIAAAEAADMVGLAARWRAALDAARPAPARAALHGPAQMTLAPQPGYWRVSAEGEVATVADRVGMRYLARLVQSPDRQIPAVALVAADGAAMPNPGADPVLDRAALVTLRTRVAELRARPVLTAPEEDELEMLLKELAGAVGFGGRTRVFADAPERARTAVRKAIKRAIEQVAATNPVVGHHLAARVSTGSVCCYRVTG